MDYSNFTQEEAQMARDVIQEKYDMLEEQREDLLYKYATDLLINVMIPIYEHPLEEEKHKGSAEVLSLPTEITEFGGEVIGWCKLRMFDGKEKSDWINIKYIRKGILVEENC